MEILINKKLALTLFILFLIVNILGVPILFEILALINHVNVSGEIIYNLFILNIGSIISSLSGLIVAFGMYVIANKLKLDKFTWFTIGLIYGKYSLLLLLIVIIVENKHLLINLQKTLQFILLLLIMAYLLNISSNYFMGHYRETIFIPKILKLDNYAFRAEFPAYLSALSIIGNFFVIALNISFAIKISKWIRDFNMTKKSIWVISTLIFGLFAILLFHKLIIIKNLNNIE